VYEEVVLTADSGFHREESVKKLLDRGIHDSRTSRNTRRRPPTVSAHQGPVNTSVLMIFILMRLQGNLYVRPVKP
jgi:hypothetical protein